MNDEIVAGDANGRVLLRRAKSSLERAEDVHGPVQQVAEIQVHADCYHSPQTFGVCTMRFADGRYWCFACGTAWMPGPESP